MSEVIKGVKKVRLAASLKLLTQYHSIEGDKPSMSQLLNAAIEDYITTAQLKAEFAKIERSKQ